jgi:hypothetical protein
MMNKIIILLIGFFVLAVIFFVFYNNSAAQIISPAQTPINLSIQLEVFKGPRDKSSTPLFEAGVENRPVDWFETSAITTVVAGSDYKITFSGLNSDNNFSFKQQKLWPTELTTSPQTLSPVDNIIGTFNSPQGDFELWKIWIEQGSKKSNAIYFYLVKPEIAYNSNYIANDCSANNNLCAYKIKINPAVIGNPPVDKPASSILTLYWNKAYCFNKLAAADSKNRLSLLHGIEHTVTVPDLSAQSNALARITIPSSLTNINRFTQIFNNSAVSFRDYNLTIKRHKPKPLQQESPAIHSFQILGSVLSSVVNLKVGDADTDTNYYCFRGFCYECAGTAQPPNASCKVVESKKCKNITTVNPKKSCAIRIRE